MANMRYGYSFYSIDFHLADKEKSSSFQIKRHVLVGSSSSSCMQQMRSIDFNRYCQQSHTPDDDNRGGNQAFLSLVFPTLYRHYSYDDTVF